MATDEGSGISHSVNCFTHSVSRLLAPSRHTGPTRRVSREERDGFTSRQLTGYRSGFKHEACSPNEDEEAVMGILQSTRKSTKKVGQDELPPL